MSTTVGEHLDEPLGTPPGGQMRVLVVDDDELDRRTVRRALVRAELPGLRIDEAEDAKSAIQMLTASKSRFTIASFSTTASPATPASTCSKRCAAGGSQYRSSCSPARPTRSRQRGQSKRERRSFLTKGSHHAGAARWSIRAAIRVGQVEASLAEANRRLREQAEQLEQQVDESLALTEELERANEQLYEAKEIAEAARPRSRALNRIGSILASELDVERIVQTVTDEATALTGAQFGAFFYNVVDKQGEKLHALHALRRAARGLRELRPCRAPRRCSRRLSTARRSCAATTSPRTRATGKRRRTTACRRAICPCAATSPCR